MISKYKSKEFALTLYILSIILFCIYKLIEIIAEYYIQSTEYDENIFYGIGMGLFSDFYSCLYNYLRTTYAFLVYYSIERKPFKGERQIFICFGVVYIFYPNTLNSSALYFAKIG